MRRRKRWLRKRKRRPRKRVKYITNKLNERGKKKKDTKNKKEGDEE